MRYRTWGTRFIAGIVIGLGLAYLGLRDHRLDRFTQLSPVMPTTAKVVMSASSTDGLSFAVQDSIVVSRLASQAHRLDSARQLQVVGTDPTVLAGRYRTEAPAPPALSTLWSVDPGTGSREAMFLAPCVNPAGVKTKTPVQCVDPVLVDLPDGSTRMFFVRMAGRADPAFAGEPNHFYSATLAASGEWMLDPGVRLSAVGAADPDVVWTQDGRLRMYFTRGAHDAGGALSGPGIFSAVSDDGGASFVAEPGLRVSSCSASATVALPGQGYRMYCHRRDIFSQGPGADPRAYIVSHRSADGLLFEEESGVRVGPELGGELRTIGAAAPSVQIDGSGAVHMLFTTVEEPPFPDNWVYLRNNARHFERVATASAARQP